MREQFTVAYQVKTDLRTGRVSGVEALLRWRHPDLGLVPPADFIPLAENMGLIAEIGAWVMETACRQCREWHLAGLPEISVAVNVSALQFRETDVPSVVARALQISGLPARFLELELTESVLMQRVDEISTVLRQLRGMGIHISIDDFGTGYSSLSYLSKIPLDALKIDRSFVNDIGDGDGGQGGMIVTTIVGLAHNLKLKAVAEGVETHKQADFLRERGCDEIQGYLVSRPVSARDVVTLLGQRLLLPKAARRGAPVRRKKRA